MEDLEVEKVDEVIEGVEEPVVESRPVEAVPDKVVEKAEEVVDKVEEPAVDAKAVEVVDKVEEPGVDAKVVEGRIADLGPDLARSQLLEKIRRLEETKEGPDLRIGPSLAPRDRSRSKSRSKSADRKDKKAGGDKGRKSCRS